MATNRSNYDYEEIIKNFGREKLIKWYNKMLETILESYKAGRIFEKSIV